MLFSRRLAWLGFAAVLLGTPAAHATVSDPGFSETLYSPATTQITALAWAPDGSNRLFYLRKNGQIRLIQDGTPVLPIFASISPIYISSECGLLGIAFDPDFVNNHFVYVFVTVAANEQRILRFTDNANVGEDPVTIVSGLPTRGANHDGGGIGFGPDGKLYWSIGDNGNRTGVDDDLTSLAAKVGRANRDGSVPADNPFVDGAGPNNDYVWARGFRNPFKLRFDPVNEALWVNVTGDQYEQIFAVTPGGDAGWDNYQSNQPAGYLPPVISYRTNSVDTRAIVSAVRSGGVASFVTSVPHRFWPGAKVTIAGVSDPSFDVTGFVRSVPSATELTVEQAGPAATSSAGTIKSQVIGGAVTGGVFWDSSGVPAAYRGNFFFGDYNTGRLMRAVLDPGGHVSSVDEWGTDITRFVDMDVGPDGALYYAAFSGGIYRAAYAFPVLSLLVSRLHLRLPEGGSTAFSVSLSARPPQSRTVKVAWDSGDPDVSVASGASLHFDDSNWSTPQAVVVAAAQDADAVDDVATLSVGSTGLLAQTVTVRVTDDDAAAIFVSSTSVALTEGGSTDVQVSLSAPPQGSTVVNVQRASGDPDVVFAPEQLTFDAGNWSTPQPLHVSAQQDADALDDAATLTLSASGLPERSVSVQVTDDDPAAPRITSSPPPSAIVGAPYVYDAVADGLPVPTWALDRSPQGMALDAATGHLAWVPAAPGTERVTLRAQNGVPPDAVQDFMVEVSEDQPPSCVIVAPQGGAVLSGSMAEFYGNVQDDVGVAQVSFAVDGAEQYTEPNANPDGEYYFGGAHAAFDTTRFDDGPHQLEISAQDSAGQPCSAEVSVVIDNAGAAGQGGAGATAQGGEVAQGDEGARSAGAGPLELGGAPNAAGGAAGSPETASGGKGGETEGGGCACRMGAQGSGRPAWLLLAGLLATSRRRRRSRRGKRRA